MSTTGPWSAPVTGSTVPSTDGVWSAPLTGNTNAPAAVWKAKHSGSWVPMDLTAPSATP